MRTLLASAIALALLAPGQAQIAYAPSATFVKGTPSGGAVVATTTVTPRLVRALRSPSAAVRTEALHAVANLAYSPQGADLSPAVLALLDVFRTDPDERLRIMALRSLEASGDEGVMTALRREAWRESVRQPHPKVRRLLFVVLVDHYGVDALRSDSSVLALAGTLRDSARR